MARVDADELENAMILADPPRAGRAWVCPASGAVLVAADMVGRHRPLPDDIREDGHYIAVPGAGRLGLGPALVLDFVRLHMPVDEADVRALLGASGGFVRFSRLAQTRGLLAAWHAFRQERTLAALRAWCEANGLALDA
ncbi:hypothetical protein [Massilia sp. MS-15]|uniref:hypothetical protein n=1 Tax=Massilia sp. MS-15 TaxID=2878200 RepID=UPI001CD5DE95|nr:hypothetical protein [Massilia sp. MS-15]MCA1247855.1 hypothetical protein [Massilia sp. MS-15]